MAKVVLSGHHVRFPKCPRVNRIKFAYGEGLLTSGGGRWQAHRHMMNGGFHAESLRDMVRIFGLHAEKAVAEWTLRLRAATAPFPGADSSVVVDMPRELKSLCIDIIAHSSVGFHIRRSSDHEQFSADLEAVYEEADRRLLVDPTDWWPRLFPRRASKVDAAVSRMKTMVDNVVADRLRAFSAGGEQARSVESLLDILLTVSEKGSAPGTGEVRRPAGDVYASRLSRVELRDHVMTFMLAGQANSSSALGWVLYELCMHPDVQARCQEEVDAVNFALSPGALQMRNRGAGFAFHGPSHSAPSSGGGGSASGGVGVGPQQQPVGGGGVGLAYEDVLRLEYLMQVVKEALRLHPVVPTIARRCAQDCSLGQYRLKANSVVLVSATSLHRHPDFWARPDEFNPDRFSREEQRRTMQSPFQYVPFSAGPRNCIGQRFAQMQMIVVLASLLSAFTFSLSPPESRAKMHVRETTSCQLLGLHVRVTRREERANIASNVV